MVNTDMSLFHVATSVGRWKHPSLDLIDHLVAQFSQCMPLNWDDVVMHEDGDHPTKLGVIHIAHVIGLFFQTRCDELCIISDSTLDWQNWRKDGTTWIRDGWADDCVVRVLQTYGIKCDPKFESGSDTR